MPSLTALAIRNGRVTTMVMMLLVILGALTYAGFPKREDPAITVRTAIVSASNPGLTLFQLEELVARPIEEVARAIPGVEEVRTRLTDGRAILQIDIENAVREGDIKRVFDEIRDDVAALERDMPDGTRGPNVNTDFGDVAIASIAVSGPGYTDAQLADFAEELRDLLYALDAISAVTLHGVQEERVWLTVDRSRLAAIGTTLQPVIAALQNQNVRLPAGSFVSDGTRVPLDTSGDYGSLAEIEATLVELPDIGLIRLGDLVSVERGVADPPQDPVYHNGARAIVVAAQMYEGEDIIAVGEALQAVVVRFLAQQPVGVSAQFATFQPQKVADSVNGALANMAQTFVVVVAVMLLFLGLRQAVVIASIIPFALAFAFIGMSALGIELQQVSIAAIIISLGLLVDNGVVIIEDMDRRIRQGADRREAAIAAGRQYTAPLLIASTTTVAAFLPLFLLDGTEGQYGFSLGAVVALMLTGSFLSAITILPSIALKVLPQPNGAPRNNAFSHLADGYAFLVRQVVRVPALMLAFVAALVVFGATQFGEVRQQMFPLSERNQFLVYMDLPNGADVTRTEAVGLRLSNWLTDRETNPEVTGATLFVGFGGPRFVLTLDPADDDAASAFLIVNTDTFKGSAAAMARLERWAAQNLSEARLRIKRLAMGGREPGVDVEISGPDADRLLAAAYTVEAGFADASGITENQNDWGEKRVEGRVVVAQDRVREYGLSSKSIADAMEGFLDGHKVSVFREGDDMIPIIVRGEPAAHDGFDDLANVAIEANGTIVALDQIATLQPDLAFSTLRRIDQRRTVTVTASSDVLSAYELLDHIDPTLKRLRAELGPAYAIEIAGEVENSAEVRGKLGAGAPAALTVMLLALIVQFNSFRRVGLTLLTVPLVVVGVPLALLTFDQPMSFFGTLGLIALSGIIINNAIVLIDQIDIERQDKALDDAIVEAARKRFRPILLTSLTTVIGLFPMAAAGGALWEPMATLMMGGLGVASILALFTVPALYRILFRADRVRKKGAAPMVSWRTRLVRRFLRRPLATSARFGR